MDALLAAILMFLPAIIYFVRSPYRPSAVDILSATLGIWIGLTALIYVGNWIQPKTGGYLSASIAWLFSCGYSWKLSNKEKPSQQKKK